MSAMVMALIQATATFIAWLATRGIDSTVGKWLAYVTIAWEQGSTVASKAAFDAAMLDIKAQSPEKAQAWADWRKRAANSKPAS